MLGRNKTQKDAYMLKKVLKMLRLKQLRQDHPLQREAGQWTNEAKSGLVSTIIKQEDVDPIRICEQFLDGTSSSGSNTPVLWLIDGLQRLSVCDEFQHNVFRISKNIKFPIVYYQNDNGEFVEYDLRGKLYKDLPEELKDEFENYQIDIRKYLDCNDEDIAYHIERINAHVGMNTNQKNILVMPNIADRIKNVYENQDFFKNNGTYTEAEVTKGKVKNVICESIMAMFHLDKWKVGKSMGKYLNENATKEEFEIFKSELSRLENIIVQKETGKLFNSKHSFLFFALFHKFTRYNLQDTEFVKFLEEFQSNLQHVEFEKYENKSFVEYSKKKNTKDKKVVITKLDMLETLMNDFFGVKHENEVISTEESGEFERISTLDFVKENVYEDVTEEDIDFYNECLTDYTVEVDNNSLLLNNENHNSLIGVIAYSFKDDLDVELWLPDYFSRYSTYNKNQKENFIHMKKDINQYFNIVDKGVA